MRVWEEGKEQLVALADKGGKVGRLFPLDECEHVRSVGKKKKETKHWCSPSESVPKGV